jgi:succinylglutamate desuccinylase
MTLCKSCNAKIDFIKTTAGKWMPVDPDYVDYEDAENGDVLITDGGVVYTVDHQKNYTSVSGRVSHFATCPNADKHRKVENGK